MDLYRDLTLLTALAARRLRARFKERLPDGGPSATEWMALWAISEAGGRLGQGQLAEKMDLNDPALTRLVNGLVKQGFASREVSEGDRRFKVLTLTEKAKPYLDEGSAIGRKLREEVFAGLSNEEIGACMQVLRRVIHRLG